LAPFVARTGWKVRVTGNGAKHQQPFDGGDVGSKDYDEMTPEEHVKAWASMGPAGDRDRIVKVLDEAERVVREMGRDLDYLRHPEQWDDFGYDETDPLEYVQRRLKNFDETPYLLARLGDLRNLLDQVLPASTGG
jgi:hypothetical protein